MQITRICKNCGYSTTHDIKKCPDCGSQNITISWFDFVRITFVSALVILVLLSPSTPPTEIYYSEWIDDPS